MNSEGTGRIRILTISRPSWTSS